jgi:hypothetical protein
MCRHTRPPSQGWRTFLSNHVDGVAAIDFFVLPTIAFQILYCLVSVRHGRRLWVSFGVTANPTAEWSRAKSPRRSRGTTRRDILFGIETPRMVQSSCSRSVQWAFETVRSHPDRPGKMLTLRLIGSIRRECFDHMIVFGEAHLRRTLRGYAAYNVSRTHRSLNKDAPLHRAIERLGAVLSRPVLGGLHHQYCRI